MAKLIEFPGYDPPSEVSTLGQRLFRYRQRHGLTQRRLARKMKVDHSSIWAWETGEHKPNSQSMLRIQQLIGE